MHLGTEYRKGPARFPLGRCRQLRAIDDSVLLLVTGSASYMKIRKSHPMKRPITTDFRSALDKQIRMDSARRHDRAQNSP